MKKEPVGSEAPVELWTFDSEAENKKKAPVKFLIAKRRTEKKAPVELSLAKRRTEKKEPVALLPVVLGKIGVNGAIKNAMQRLMLYF